MLKDLQVTLYDVFGYFLPGCICAVALGILFWSVIMPDTALSPPQTVVAGWLIVGVLVAYTAGHMVQAIANVLMRFFRKYLLSVEELMLSKLDKGGISDALTSSAKAKASLLLHVDEKVLDPNTLYCICDEAVVQFGVVTDRDVYIYREGFYRGLTISFSLLCVSLVIRMLVPGAFFNLSGTQLLNATSMLLFGAATSLVAAGLSFGRYRRFGRYRVKQALLGFLLIPEDKIKGKVAE